MFNTVKHCSFYRVVTQFYTETTTICSILILVKHSQFILLIEFCVLCRSFFEYVYIVKMERSEPNKEFRERSNCHSIRSTFWIFDVGIAVYSMLISSIMSSQITRKSFFITHWNDDYQILVYAYSEEAFDKKKTNVCVRLAGQLSQ